jgi:hypothetical protein
MKQPRDHARAIGKSGIDAAPQSLAPGKTTLTQALQLGRGANAQPGLNSPTDEPEKWILVSI